MPLTPQSLVPESTHTPLPVVLVPLNYQQDSIEAMIGVRASGGATMHSLISAASVNATVVSATPGQIYGLQVFNLNAAARYLKLYDKATTPAQTDTPVKRLLIPGGGTTVGAGFVYPAVYGLEFLLGIGYRLTTGIADSDTGAVAASEILVNMDYAV